MTYEQVQLLLLKCNHSIVHQHSLTVALFWLFIYIILCIYIHTDITGNENAQETVFVQYCHCIIELIEIIIYLKWLSILLRVSSLRCVIWEEGGMQ